MCETPKSPPGDYNARALAPILLAILGSRVKHLNPRQGITTIVAFVLVVSFVPACETPKSPPGDYNNSRQNRALASSSEGKCETPKSPPGDYNSFAASSRLSYS